MVHAFDGKPSARAAQSQIHRDRIQGKASPRDGKQAGVDGVLARVGLVGGWIGGGDRNHILRSELANNVGIIAHELAVPVQLVVAESIEGVQTKLVFLPIVDPIAVSVHIRYGDSEELSGQVKTACFGVIANQSRGQALVLGYDAETGR